jgi:predicted Mrr-cat superfamily restriction endonuclease
MTSEDDVTSELDKDFWSQTTVNAVIAAKVEKRAAKGLILNCYSLDVEAREEKDERFNEEKMHVFANLIYERASSLKDGEKLRFQVAVKVNRVHWTAIDVKCGCSGR